MVRVFGREANPAQRLRNLWADEMKSTRLDLGWTLEELAAALAEEGDEYKVTPQAISAWERGKASPRVHMQIAWCKVTKRRHRDVFVMTNEAA